MPPRVKNLSNYRNGQLARMDALQSGYDTSLILNQQGKVAEGPGACVVIVRDNKLITPDLTQSVLESITRASLQSARLSELKTRLEVAHVPPATAISRWLIDHFIDEMTNRSA